jgi:hypothetical protein
MSELKLKHPKSTKEKGLKTCTVQIVGKRSAIDADLKPISAWFLMEGTFEIEKTKNDKYKNFSLIRIFRAQKFTWDLDFHMHTTIFLSDSFTTFMLKPTEPMPNGVDFSITSPKKISQKEADELINLKGAYVVKLDAEDNLQTLAVARFG